MDAYPVCIGAAGIAIGAVFMYAICVATGEAAAAMGSITVVWAVAGGISGAVTSGTVISCTVAASTSPVFLREEEVVFFFFEDFFFLLPSPQEPYITAAPKPRSPRMMSRMPHQGKPPSSSPPPIIVPFVPLVRLLGSGTGGNTGATVATGPSVVNGGRVGRGVVVLSGQVCGPETTRPEMFGFTSTSVAFWPTTQQPPAPTKAEKLPWAFHTQCRQ
mmetsp:Transcript_68082/g.102688  ORF Transcript_68082/g.102688 Transcript_68082/m.102688 type:complete len:217 (+) Transcript_68082:122-772(+)